jgi:ankyrin repeat protein
LLLSSQPQCHTCLHKAAFRGAHESFGVLMAQFYTCSAANALAINQIDLNGNTALAIAIINHHRVYNLDNGAKLRIANLPLIEELIKAGASTQLVNNDKNSMAHLVCLSTYMSAEEKRKILKLLSLSADEFSNQKNIYNQTAFELLRNSINSAEVSAKQKLVHSPFVLILLFLFFFT